ncbi:hypothetical protein B0H14DRAFT_2675211 [Mycena olivaceomarginata]|nr:hypothetical protein B0H14DRAFT_2675211 [Mycena olivaceomarginata]
MGGGRESNRITKMPRSERRAHGSSVNTPCGDNVTFRSLSLSERIVHARHRHHLLALALLLPPRPLFVAGAGGGVTGSTESSPGLVLGLVLVLDLHLPSCVHEVIALELGVSVPDCSLPLVLRGRRQPTAQVESRAREVRSRRNGSFFRVHLLAARSATAAGRHPHRPGSPSASEGGTPGASGCSLPHPHPRQSPMPNRTPRPISRDTQRRSIPPPCRRSPSSKRRR